MVGVTVGDPRSQHQGVGIGTCPHRVDDHVCVVLQFAVRDAEVGRSRTTEPSHRALHLGAAVGSQGVPCPAAADRVRPLAVSGHEHVEGHAPVGQVGHQPPDPQRLVIGVCGDDQHPAVAPRHGREVQHGDVVPALVGQPGALRGSRVGVVERHRGQRHDAPPGRWSAVGATRPSERRQVALGMVLAQVEREVGDPGGVHRVERERPRAQRVADRGEHLLGAPGGLGAHPPRQHRPDRPSGLTGVDPRGGVAQRRAAWREGRRRTPRGA